MIDAGGPAPSGASYAPTARCDTWTGHLERPSTQTPAKRPGREPGDSVGSTPTSVTDNTIPWSNGDDTCVTCRRRWFNSIRDHSKGLQVFRKHTSVVRTRIGFNSRADLCNWACMPMEATDPCKIGVMGSTPIRSTYEMDGDL